MLTANDLLGSVGCTFKFIGGGRIRRGTAVDGFGDRVVVYSGPIFGYVEDGVLTLKASQPDLANGTFIEYEDHGVTMGTAITGGFLASHRFGGCDFTILRKGNGAIVGAHVFSNGPKDEDNARGYLKSLPSGWSRVGTWESTPYIDRWPNTSLLAFAFPGGNQVEIVALGVGGYPAPKVKHVELAARLPVGRS